MQQPSLHILIVICSAALLLPGTTYADTKKIMIGAKLAHGYGLGVDSSDAQRDWLYNEGDHFRMAYPSGQSWGAVFVTIGDPTNPPRPFQDFSVYKTLLIDMKGGAGGETVSIGIKTNTQPDNGAETKIRQQLTNDWQTYRFPLQQFKGADLKRLYVVTEFVFEGSSPRTVLFRNIAFSGKLNDHAGSNRDSQITIGAGVYLRDTPQGKKRSIVHFGTVVSTLDQATDEELWFKVSTNDGREGWMLGSYLHKIDLENTTKTYLDISSGKLSRSEDFGDLVEVTNFLIRIKAETLDTEPSNQLDQLLKNAIGKTFAAIPANKQHESPYIEWIREHSDSLNAVQEDSDSVIQDAKLKNRKVAGIPKSDPEFDKSLTKPLYEAARKVGVKEVYFLAGTENIHKGCDILIYANTASHKALPDELCRLEIGPNGLDITDKQMRKSGIKEGFVNHKLYIIVHPKFIIKAPTKTLVYERWLLDYTYKDRTGDVVVRATNAK